MGACRAWMEGPMRVGEAWAGQVALVPSLQGLLSAPHLWAWFCALLGWSS